MWSDGEHGHHVITWTQFETVFNQRRIPSNWQLAIGHDWGSTKSHPAVVSWVARAAEGSPLEGAFFLFREQVFIGALVDDVAEGIQDNLERDQADHRVRLWRMSHEARSERDTYRRKYGLPFQPMKQGKHDGIAQLRYVLRLQDIDQPHPFKPWINGHPLLYLIVDDDQARNPRDEKGLARHRSEFAAYRYTEPEISQTRGQTLPIPFKLFDDAMDAMRGIFAEWGPSIEARSDVEEFREALPLPFRDLPSDDTPVEEKDMWALAFWVAAAKAKEQIKKEHKGRLGLDDEAEAEIEFNADADNTDFPQLFHASRIADLDYDF